LTRTECGNSPRFSRSATLTRYHGVFAIDIERCWHCGGRLKVIASIEEPDLIERILARLDRDGASIDPAHPSRAPPQGRLPI
jgi:hypothetical protein